MNASLWIVLAVLLIGVIVMGVMLAGLLLVQRPPWRHR